MGKQPFLSVISNKQEIYYPTYEESREYQAKLMGLWEQQQRVLGYTEHTIALGTKCLNEFLDVSNKFIWEVTMSDADKFYLGLVGRGLAYSTRRKYQSTISTFLEYLKTRHGHEIWERYRVQVPNLLDKFNRYYHRKDDHNGQVIPPKPELLARFWNGLKEEMKTARKYSTVARDYSLFRMLELTGLRTHEIIMMDVKDCRFDLGEKGKIHVRFGKGSMGSGFKRRWVPMLDDVDILIKWYLERIRPLFATETAGPLFLSEGGVRLNKHTARKSLARRQEKMGFTKEEIFSPHQLRHSFATRQTELGVDLLTLKELLGHADVATTFNYSNPGSDHLEKRVRMAQEKWRNQLLNFNKKGE
ncbi:tyrosine-type recombinase/integrase [Peribacillus simplex]|uniref:Tyrosine-type recombinase/integrase n=2 Tax=Peribacillus TaxID=2675229 RepID=A0AA90SYN6_9BACI|nr:MULTISPECIES: tyrosine-type recombinase/integrase [Peribacillus]MDP1421681.1 tyrosine-type recombinase/integrase [Peribacillus simplex]MDP1454395.1 tyrosine-type recombinase/integrase [Peribacillus frigoritolerans]